MAKEGTPMGGIPPMRPLHWSEREINYEGTTIIDHFICSNMANSVLLLPLARFKWNQLLNHD